MVLLEKFRTSLGVCILQGKDKTDTGTMMIWSGVGLFYLEGLFQVI